MNKHTFRIFLFALFVTLLSACGLTEAEQQVMIKDQVQASVAETVVALPTQTPQATQTPLPTYTPLPTFTAVPSQTPQPTYTPLPTFTSLPTASPSPTATDTPLPTTAPTVNIVAPTSASVVDTQEQLLITIQNVLANIENFRGSLRLFTPGTQLQGGGQPLPSDCPAIVSAFNTISNILIIDPSAQDPIVQNSYTIYRSATDNVLALMSPWIDVCHTVITEGEPKRIVDENQYGILYPAFDEFIAQLNQVVNDLRES